MVSRFRLCAAFPFIASLATVTPAQAAQPITGRWATVDGKAIVQIAPCGRNICGRIERIVKPTPGRPQTDINNPDPALRSRPLARLALLSGFSDAGAIWKGTIYDPESGKSYNSKVSRNPDGTLKVQGCIAFFCKTQTWTAVR
ncbi:MAG: DUF2147 domain-containing protein [Sphingobium sp.]